LNHIHLFPDDIGIYEDSRTVKIVDVNGCMEQLNSFDTTSYGPFIDLIMAEDGKFGLAEFVPLFNWKWNTDSEPIQYASYRGYKWPLPNNWAKAIAGDFKDGRIAYTYMTRELDPGADNFSDVKCSGTATNNNFKRGSYKWETDNNGLLKRDDN